MNRKTKIKLSLSDRIFNAVNIFIMLVIAAVMLAPIIHVVCVSFSLGSEIQKGGLFLWPHGFTLEGYKKVLQDHMIVRSYINTVIYAFSHTASGNHPYGPDGLPADHQGFPLKKRNHRFHHHHDVLQRRCDPDLPSDEGAASHQQPAGYGSSLRGNSL